MADPNQPTFNPWTVVRHTIQLLIDEDVTSTVSYGDRIGGADPLRGAEELLRGLGVEPTIPTTGTNEEEDNQS